MTGDVMRYSFLSIMKSGLIFIILCMILTTSLFTSIMQTSDDIFRDLYVRKIINNPQLLDTECIALSHNMDDARTDKTYDTTFYSRDMLEFYKKDKAVDKVYGFDISLAEYNETPVKINTGYSEIFDLINTDLQPSSWFEGSDPNDEYPAAVVCGEVFKNVRIGDVITLQGKKEVYERVDIDKVTNEVKDTGFISVRVIEKICYPYLAPDFSWRFENKENSAKENRIKFCQSPVVYLEYNEKSISALKKADVNITPADSFVYVSFITDDKVFVSDFHYSVEKLKKYGAYTPLIKTVEKTSDFINGKDGTGWTFLPEILLNNKNLSLAATCYLLITLTIAYIIWRNLRLTVDDYRLNTSLISIFGKIIIMTTVPLIVSVITFTLYLYSRTTVGIFSGLDPGFFSTNYFTSIIILMIVVWIFLIITTMIYPIVKYRSFKTSTVRTAESCTYNPIETYTDYEERDFEISGGYDSPLEENQE